MNHCVVSAPETCNNCVPHESTGPRALARGGGSGLHDRDYAPLTSSSQADAGIERLVAARRKQCGWGANEGAGGAAAAGAGARGPARRRSNRPRRMRSGRPIRSEVETRESGNRDLEDTGPKIL